MFNGVKTINMVHHAVSPLEPQITKWAGKLPGIPMYCFQMTRQVGQGTKPGNAHRTLVRPLAHVDRALVPY